MDADAFLVALVCANFILGVSNLVLTARSGLLLRDLPQWDEPEPIRVFVDTSTGAEVEYPDPEHHEHSWTWEVNDGFGWRCGVLTRPGYRCGVVKREYENAR